MLRRLLSVLLCTCLALQGATVALAAEAPCPMQAEMAAMVLAGGDLDLADLPDCCNDPQTWAETGQLCKTGVDCQGFVAWAPAPAAHVIGVAPSYAIPDALSSSEPKARPATPWRPPSTV
jgi:hypothetical protein